jgi:regulator of nucleoside diphosphate kinase
MHATIHGERTLTELDFSRLSKLSGCQLSSELADLLAVTEVVSSRDISAKLVTMYSRVEIVDAHTLRRQALTLCFPSDAEPAAGFISVLSPVGFSLIGLKEGEVARWSTPSGEECSAEVTSVLYQPEANGDYTT